jgi:hypothetical protein
MRVRKWRGDAAMFRRRVLKSIHLASTVWFVACVGYIFVLGLHQAGVNWWVVFSLSGHGALIVFLLISLYLFAVFRGISSSQKVQIEHPLTSTPYYSLFYMTGPFLGGMAGCLGTIGVSGVSQFLLGVALGTFVTTFLVWVVVDPVIGLLEMVIVPASRKHRSERLAQMKAERERKQRESECLLAEVLAKEESDVRLWREMLRPQAEKLAGLLTSDWVDFEKAQREAVGIGAGAWRIGGLGCMRTLRDMAMEICRQRSPDRGVVDYVTTWWDGIGSWRGSSLCEMKNP